MINTRGQGLALLANEQWYDVFKMYKSLLFVSRVSEV